MSGQKESRTRILGGLLAVVVTVSTVVAYRYFEAPEATLVKEGDVAPELELQSLGGAGKTRLSQFRGRPVLLTMFMSKCRICASEIFDIERLHRAYLRKGLVVLGVSVDPDRETLRRFVKEKNLTFFVLEDFDAATVRQLYGSWKMPEHYLIDADGRVVKVFLGSVAWQSADVIGAVESLLPEKPFQSPESSSSTAPTR